MSDTVSKKQQDIHAKHRGIKHTPRGLGEHMLRGSTPWEHQQDWSYRGVISCFAFVGWGPYVRRGDGRGKRRGTSVMAVFESSGPQKDCRSRKNAVGDGKHTLELPAITVPF